MEINKQEFVDYLKNRICPVQLALWESWLKENPSLIGTNIDPKDNHCEVSIDVYGKMIERSGKDRVSLIELGGGLPREGFYLLESGLIEKLVVIDKCSREADQVDQMAEILGLEKGVEAIQMNLEKQKIGDLAADLMVSRNFLYGAANSVREYMFEPGLRVHVDNGAVLRNSKEACEDLFGVIRIIANDEGNFNHKRVARELRRNGFGEVDRGSLKLQRYTRSGLQISTMYGVRPVQARDSFNTKVDYVIGQKR